jgi:protein SCO1/2
MERKRVAEATKGIGRPKVGGKFELVDTEGRSFTEENLKGKYALVSNFTKQISAYNYAINTLMEHKIDAIFDRSTSASPTAPTSAPKSSTKWPT